jgi:hypothetical protein
MKKWMKVTLLVVLTLGVFVGVGLYDASGRATRLQNGAHRQLDLCEMMAAQAGSAREACIPPFRQSLEASSGLAMWAAIPLALGGVAVLWMLIGLGYGVRRWRGTAAD